MRTLNIFLFHSLRCWVIKEPDKAGMLVHRLACRVDARVYFCWVQLTFKPHVTNGTSNSSDWWPAFLWQFLQAKQNMIDDGLYVYRLNCVICDSRGRRPSYKHLAASARRTCTKYVSK